MELNIDTLINTFSKYSNKKKEVDEQDAAPAPSTPSTSVPKWADVVGGPTRGKANMLGKAGEKWATGMNRGVANQIW